MTLPVERTKTLLNVKHFLYDLIDPKKTPRVPSKVRRAARSLLKHYPSDWDIDQLYKKLPKVFGKIFT